MVDDQCRNGHGVLLLQPYAQLFLQSVKERDGDRGRSGIEGGSVRGGSGRRGGWLVELAFSTEAHAEVIAVFESGGIDNGSWNVSTREGVKFVGEFGHGHVLARDQAVGEWVVDTRIFAVRAGTLMAGASTCRGGGFLHFGIVGQHRIYGGRH